MAGSHSSTNEAAWEHEAPGVGSEGAGHAPGDQADPKADGNADRNADGTGLDGGHLDDALEADEVDRFARLETLVRSLVSRFDALRGERDELHAQLERRETRMRELEEELRQSNQLRQDVGKRVDDLIAQLDGIVGDGATGVNG